MSTRSRQKIYGSRVMGAKIRAQDARQAATKAIREADRAEAEAWSIRMEGFGGPAQPSPTIGQCLNGGLGWLEVECNRCKTRASLPLDAIRRPPPARHADLETRSRAEMPVLPQGPLRAAGAYDQADGGARDHAVSLGASG
jgi:hypothetical protein